jgi:hypothetical protein
MVRSDVSWQRPECNSIKAGILLVPVEVSDPDKLDSAFATLGTERVEALLIPPDTTFYSRRKQITDLAAKARLPAIYGYREHVEVGGLMSYGPDISDQYVHIDDGAVLVERKRLDLALEDFRVLHGASSLCVRGGKFHPGFYHCRNPLHNVA